MASTSAASAAADPVIDLLKPVRDAIVDKPPYISGTLPLQNDNFTIFYQRGDAARRINLATASPEELQDLADACQPATFGREQEDVMDENYRKAGKLDSQAFSTSLVPERTSLVDIVRGYLLEGKESSRPISLELYKLNVYSKGSFFKAHVDTPRGGNMFGSLVLVFPTPHEGGALLLRHGGEEWAFDSAAAVATTRESIGYVAFFSDIEHEVTPVTAGHRVTLTYNLYFVDSPARASASGGTVIPAVPSAVPANELAFRAAFETLLQNPEFLPDGGTLGFGLRHVYPVQGSKSLAHVYGLLKGSDAAVFRVCGALGFEPVLYLRYTAAPKYGSGRTSAGLIDTIPALEGFYEVEDPVDMIKASGGLVLRKAWDDGAEVDERVQWVTKITKLTVHKNAYLAYGNEAELGYTYGLLCMIVRVGKPGERTAFLTVAAMKEAARRKKNARHD